MLGEGRHFMEKQSWKPAFVVTQPPVIVLSCFAEYLCLCLYRTALRFGAIDVPVLASEDLGFSLAEVNEKNGAPALKY